MTIPLWVLLGFAAWTLFTLVVTVGSFRWARILTGRTQIAELQADRVDEQGSDFYRRAMRAHANCVENLPVYGAIAVTILATGADDSTLDALALVFIGARVLHTSTHVLFKQTDVATGVRFAFFLVQFVCMGWMGIHVALLSSQ